MAALAGCAVNPATGGSQFTLVSPAQDAALGAREHPKVLAEYGGEYADPEVRALVDRVGRRIAAASARPDVDYTFTVLDSPIANAFALPGGYVYVTRGLLAIVGDEAELAAVLGHEIAHVAARHSAARATQSTIAQVALVGLAVVGLGPIAGQAAGTTAELLLKGYSRGHELEADAIGMRYLTAAGYDPWAVVDFLQTMQRDAELKAALAGRRPDSEQIGQWLSSHPQTEERVARASALARDAAAGAEGAAAGSERGRDAFLDAVDGMIFGDTAEQGFVRGRTFFHPVLGFRFDVPEGFRIVNGADQVIAAGPDGSAIIFDADRVPPVRDVADYLADDWGARMALGRVERIEVNGMPAATAVAEARLGGTPVDARLLAIRFGPDRIYRFVFATPKGLTGAMNLALRETSYSFRRLEPAETRDLAPLRIEVRTVRPGDTLESLAAGLPLEGMAVERLAVLNGIAPGTPLEPGRRIKLIR
jgi:predicted Zn-dependent protease